RPWCPRRRCGGRALRRTRAGAGGRRGGVRGAVGTQRQTDTREDDDDEKDDFQQFDRRGPGGTEVSRQAWKPALSCGLCRRGCFGEDQPVGLLEGEYTPARRRGPGTLGSFAGTSSTNVLTERPHARRGQP